MVKKIKSKFVQILIEGPEGMDTDGEPTLRGPTKHHSLAMEWWKEKGPVGESINSIATWMYAYHELMMLVTNPESHLTKAKFKKFLQRASQALGTAFVLRSEDEQRRAASEKAEPESAQNNGP